jgi:hypothetical protein
VIAHYINLGHSLEEMLSLSSLERAFFLAAWEIEQEEAAKIYGQ